ncbi:UvrD-helicase domain-containing protein [Pseudanabaena sp. FACHB-2040]|uniref:UvrD-helicase domain-containing protein n=1 Tax=Pseudanabaena sp. FACHB-2040 TaxID=2692859 RepID=UPI00168284DC|nr:UvrD-helicase domain-containing protein [Pseudanabaena sp. FACHB-2040]MBD2256957.1 UvrD-helicase domain-containing protein [Pseudanabaena sp. FACHB-2040]
MGLTEQQKRAAHAPGSVAVTAGAGTGKTHMLAERYLYFLNRGYSPLQMVAVTFTEKAATELRSRIRRTITTHLADRPDLLAELEAAQISTFHALASRICREHPDKAEVPPDFQILEEFDSPIWQAEQMSEALAQLPGHLYQALSFSKMRDILAGLLADPLTAEQALPRVRADWLPAVASARQQALDDLLADGLWQWGKTTLAAYAAPGDKLEAHRLTAVAAIATLEQGHEIAPSLTALASLKINVGSAQNWGGKEALAEVKEALKALRGLAESTLKAGLITLQPSACDDQTEAMLPSIRAAFAWVREYLQAAKYQQRLLDFNDLEVHALKALAHPEVQTYYAQRWKVFLIDEFQDTNPIQGQFLEILTAQATLTIVGDAKQSIYGFRRADVQVFQAWQQRLHPSPDGPVELSLSFRTHQALMAQINQVFAPVLGDLHQSLEAYRQEDLEPTPALQLYTVSIDEAYKKDNTIDTHINACRRVEAQQIADLVEQMLQTPIQVHDKSTGQPRDIQPSDIAVLARNWAPLESYGSAIAARNIPVLQAGGGNLLETRPAKDVWALLRFLADSSDNLALAAVLRSPFFAISDTAFYHVAQSLADKTTWWQHLRTSNAPDLQTAAKALQQLQIARRTETPTRLLQICDRLTGYTAVIANLPGSARLLADWSGFMELVRTLEQGSYDVLGVVRRLKRIAAGGAAVPRPALEGGNAVSLMTIHGSKGLEWPVVIVPDLSHSSAADYPTLRFDADLGLALKLEDEAGESQKSALYTLLEQRQRLADREESKRVLYVALTRARDQLILTAAGSSGGGLDLLQPGLEGLIEPTPIPFHPERAQLVEPIAPELPTLPNQLMVHPAGSGFTELPVTALSDYALCPQRFKYRYVDGHPGLQSGTGPQQFPLELGQLTHKALELGIDEADKLSQYVPHLPSAIASTLAQEALTLAQKFHHSEVYAAYRQGHLQWEQPVSLKVGGLTLNGVIDLLGADFVLDFKTDTALHPEHHQFQLWAYARAAGRDTAHLAYLRHDYLHSLNAATLSHLDQSSEALVNRLVKGQFEPEAHPIGCGICPYSEICDSCV